ncbi:hypothetical protein AOL_s00091g50 [Orbilia oligospora ATCC 24927]|uniref:Uncharacterized protein n=1 Tax=Arthrobotrys oligospora (strain ATCC 24927 / CBS 115.81 / DSM 1491) TaxID=756982 RepID=G1XHZ8_ARTOA|nr:hypothetical protein AOL_s00091g50 [Orbilia oligospora ATCC 24927]EGX47229.1 hypothetical protein AOL_s00091g50 [Orbilia oligospora ATCC 24927]
MNSRQRSHLERQEIAAALGLSALRFTETPIQTPFSVLDCFLATLNDKGVQFQSEKDRNSRTRTDNQDLGHLSAHKQQLDKEIRELTFTATCFLKLPTEITLRNFFLSFKTLLLSISQHPKAIPDVSPWKTSIDVLRRCILSPQGLALCYEIPEVHRFVLLGLESTILLLGRRCKNMTKDEIIQVQASMSFSIGALRQLSDDLLALWHEFRLYNSNARFLAGGQALDDTRPGGEMTLDMDNNFPSANTGCVCVAGRDLLILDIGRPASAAVSPRHTSELDGRQDATIENSKESWNFQVGTNEPSRYKFVC